jgi:hypothetical protein
MAIFPVLLPAFLCPTGLYPLCVVFFESRFLPRNFIPISDFFFDFSRGKIRRPKQNFSFFYGVRGIDKKGKTVM